MQFFNSKGQGATEYLVLLAVVLIIGLVTTALLGFFPGVAGDVSISESTLYWSATTPIKVLEIAPLFSGTTGSVCGTAGRRGFRMVLLNSDVEMVTLTGISINNSGVAGANNYCLAGDSSMTGPDLSMAAGDQVTLDIYTDSPSVNPQFCNSTSSTASLIARFYYSKLGLAKTFYGAKPIVLHC
ncbi:MAG: hypothetical protein QW568_03170 [Candidatus Anstonellaceae archaeon]